jgi:hypothetical protein
VWVGGRGAEMVREIECAEGESVVLDEETGCRRV